MANPGMANNGSMYGHCQGNLKTISAFTEGTEMFIPLKNVHLVTLYLFKFFISYFLQYFILPSLLYLLISCKSSILSVYLPLCVSFFLFVFPSVCLPLCLSSLLLSSFMLVFLSVRLFFSLSSLFFC
jgi:hypothetical protein